MVERKSQLTVGRSIRTRLLVLLLSLTTISVLTIAYLGVNSIQRVGQSAQQTSGEALRTQAEEYLRQVTIGDAQRNDLALKRAQYDAENVAQYAAGIFERPDAFTSGAYWQAEDHMFTGPDGQYMSYETDVSDAFVPNLVDIEDELLTVLELSAYLDFILVPTYESDPNTVAIYLGTEEDVLRYYPNINIGSVVPPDFQVTQRPWYISAAPESNPERAVAWSPVYVDATGKGLMVTAAAPVCTSQGEFVGVVGIDATLEDISASVEKARLLGSGYSFLVDDTGHAIALPEQGYQDILGHSAEPDEFGADLSETTTEFAPVLAKMMAGSTGFDTLEVGGRKLFVAYAPLESTGWSLANVVKADEVLQAMATLQEELETSTRSLVLAHILPVGGGILIAVTVIGLLLTNRLTGPIQRLATVAQRIGAGEWDAPLPRTGNDEIGVLSQAFASMIAQLRELMESLEQRVAERTADLERRSVQLEAAAQVARKAAAIRDVTQLLDATVRLVSDRFGFYHAGIFLLDEAKKYAVLRAASSEGSQKMLARGHKLQVGEVGIVGWVAGSRQPRVALDVGEDAVFFDNPDLPHTRSEMALPLEVQDRVIGVLDVQSTEAAAFSDEDVAVLQTLADQLAVAIENARLMERAEAQLRELSLLQGEYSAAAWAKLASSEHSLSYVYDRIDVMPAEKLKAPVLDLALERSETVALVEPETTGTALATPLKLRDQVIGALGIQETDGTREWSPNEIALVEAVSSQVALALENARLFEQTQATLAETETLYRTSRAIGASTSPEEVGQALMDYAPTSGVDVARVLLFEHDEQGQPAYMVMCEEWTVDNRPAQPYGTRLSLEDYPLANLLNPNEPVIVEDVLTDHRANEMSRTFIATISGLRSFAMVPITVGERWIGMIFAGRNEPSTFREKLIRGYWTLAGQAAVALENLRLLEETQRRATQLATAAEVARDATAILDVGQLLDETANLISEQFGFYHAGVFLLDEQDEYAVLQAASSEGGHRMLERGHKLKVGKVGIVGHVAGTGEPRIALDVSEDTAHFAHSDLPDTRSEMALPLKVQERVIGVLDVQSIQESAFSEDDVAVLQTLADQLATAIANARLFQEVRTDAMRRALINEVQQAIAASLDPGELLHQTGEVISRRLQRPSALFLWEPGEEVLRPVAVHDAHAADVPLADGVRVTREMNPTLFSEVVDGRRICVLEPSAQGQAVPLLAEQPGIQTGVYVPLTAHDQVMGVLALAQPEERPPEGTGFVESIGANLSVALENARLYQDAVETTERLKEIDRLKTQFLANMSHELRTPLNSIIGFSRVILKGIDGPLTDMQRTDLQAVYDSGQHLLGLINDILDISKIQAGKMELSFEDTDLREIIKGVMSTAIALIKDKPVALQQSVPPDVPIIRVDARRIRQVLLNLVGNSAKFTEEGFIRVEAKASPTEMIISVADSGSGIPPDKLKNVFEEFTQIDGSSTRRAGGTGLGLAITRRFVELHGGRIWVESTLGAGSTFYIALPIEGSPQPSEKADVEEEKEQPELEPGFDQKVVLCVDDDEGVITLFRRYLSKQGYRVIGLTESTAVVEHARQLKPFAITLDVMMPDKDGWLVTQELKANPDTRHIPVIMCTIVSEKEYGLSLGASDYLVKPILEDDLVAALERLDREEGRHRVLVVDDQPEDRHLLRRMIEACEGYEVIEAASGQEAITLIRRVRPSIIILDLMMPDVDGFAVLESIKADKTTRSIPIIVVTAKDLTQEERNTLNRRVEALLQKGLFEQQELLADVAAALERIKTDRK